jgi:hypothetical protein
MARPQVADGGTASNMEVSCEYIEYAVRDSRQGAVLQLGGGKVPTTPQRENVPRYEIFTHKAPDLD